MPLGGLLLDLPHRADRGVLLAAQRTLRVVVDLVEAALVEGVLAEKMDGGEIESTAAGGAATGLEDGGFGAEFVNFFALGGCFSPVAFDEATILLRGGQW